MIKLQDETKKILNEVESICEMSKAFAYTDKRTSVSVWVENPTNRDNRYFKYYNNSHYTIATAVARIRIDKPSYVGGVHSEGSKAVWNLSKREIDKLISILQSPSTRFEGYTHWQEILITYNYDNFDLSLEDTLKLPDIQYTSNPTLPDHVKPFAIDYPMPDYTQL